ncbi:hypothetical protein [Limnohabitans sp. Jir72]|jgi:hypothetical protein|uniref:hypothetical protein n=1 Tax=Limnohabitans sp. Jir72 TaxID=1977909 RepID=UPI0011B28018|nr:hypothetical protein [Limnohabitans sp. Jir72]
MYSKTMTVLSVAAVLVGCSTASQKITAEYISPVQYQSYDCDQLAQESNRILVRVKQLGVRLDQAASNDKAIGVVGAVLFWPALFALGGTKQQEAEYARLKGEYDAISQAQILKKCITSRPTVISTPSVDVDKDFAAVADVDAVPYLNARGREGYRDWVSKTPPKAFVIAPDGTWNSTWGQPQNLENESPDALSRALSRCEKRAQGCKAYAIDGRVVWVP